MIRKTRRLRPLVALPVAVVMAGLAFSVPLLDAGPHGATPSFQAEGHGTAYLDHDHSICVQHSASPWSPAAETQIPRPLLVRARVDAPPVQRSPARFRRTSFRPRAPPIA